jgi:hypothetical protein
MCQPPHLAVIAVRELTRGLAGRGTSCSAGTTPRVLCCAAHEPAGLFSTALLVLPLVLITTGNSTVPFVATYTQ